MERLLIAQTGFLGDVVFDHSAPQHAATRTRP